MDLRSKITLMALADITPYENNPRNNEEAVEKVANSIKEFGFNQPIVVDKDNVIIVGHTRYLAAQELGLTEAPVIVAGNLSDEQAKAYRLADNKTGELAGWDFEKLALELEQIEDINMSDFGFTDDDITLEQTNDVNKEEHQSLADRFVFTPISILDSRRAEWQERKKKWFGFEIKSDTSRENMKTTGALSGCVPGYYKYKEKQEAIMGCKLSNKEFEEKYLKQYLPKNSSIKTTNSGGILSIFDPVLCELMYYWFCPAGGDILDPFSGGSVRGIIASLLGHQYTGIDLRQEQIDANIEQGYELLKDNYPKWLCGDSVNITTLAPGEYDFIFSCPPYFDLEVYSDKPNDLSNMNYDEFLKSYRSIIKQCVDMLKEDRFACFVVGDMRDKKTGMYRNFHSETIKAFIDAGACLYNDIVLITPMGSLAQRIGKQFSASRKVGKSHQNVLVFYKGNHKNIKDNFGEINTAEVLEEEQFIP